MNEFSDIFSAIGVLAIVILVNDRLSQRSRFTLFKDDDINKGLLELLFSSILTWGSFWGIIVLTNVSFRMLLETNSLADHVGNVNWTFMKYGLPFAVANVLCGAHYDRLLELVGKREVTSGPFFAYFLSVALYLIADNSLYLALVIYTSICLTVITFTTTKYNLKLVEVGYTTILYLVKSNFVCKFLWRTSLSMH